MMLTPKLDKEQTADVTPVRPSGLKYAPEAVYICARQLLRAANAHEVVEALRRLVIELGGRVVSARERGEDAIPLDITIGRGEPLYVVAEPGSNRRLIERYLPAALDDARASLDLMRRIDRLANEAGIDPLTSLPNHRSVSRILSRLQPLDAVLALALDPAEIAAKHGKSASDECVKAFSAALRQATRATDFIGYFGNGRFVVLMKTPGEDGLRRLVERIRLRWERARPYAVSFSTGFSVVNEEGWRPAIRSAELSLQQAQETPGEQPAYR
jgi:GGDEF domain-containing protein